MKKSLLALAALTAFAGVASAQSSVTLFGIMDVNARQVNNGSAGKLKTLSTDGIASSRLGVRGIEDLGGGLRAGFWLEGALGPDTGCGQTTAAGNGCNAFTWQRRSTVSLIGGFGEVRLGRDYTPTFNNIVGYEPWGYVGVATLANARGAFSTLALAGTAVRANNMISYFLPTTLGGLYGQGSVAAGEGATGNKYVGGRLGYAAGPLNVSGAYGKTYKTGLMIDDLKQTSIGASFNLGFLTVAGMYEKQTYSSANQKMLEGNIVVPFGAHQIKLSIANFKGNDLLGKNNTLATTQLGLGYQYDLSKRTAVYATYGRDANKGSATDPNGGSVFTASGTGNAGIKPGETSSGIEFGIRHSF
jgi:predicted porin